MNNNMFIPEKINVGYQNRSDTYTKRLAYIIYFDNDGVLRKEKSWNGWRDKTIKNTIFENKPQSGFVLNRHAGGGSSGWDHRQSYIRIYDPRNFEIEITIDNLLYILENCSCEKGKGLEGEFIYAWSGTELVLLPINSPDYKELVSFNDDLKNKEIIKASALIEGYTYLDNKNRKIVYMGKFIDYDYDGIERGNYFGFYNLENNYIDEINPKNLIKLYDKTIPGNYDKMLEQFEKKKTPRKVPLPKIKGKDLIEGYTYKFKNTYSEYIFLKKSMYYDNLGNAVKQKYWFYDKEYFNNQYRTKKDGILVIDSKDTFLFKAKKHGDYNKYLDILESNKNYSPIDESKSEYTKVDCVYVRNNHYRNDNNYFIKVNDKYEEIRIFNLGFGITFNSVNNTVEVPILLKDATDYEFYEKKVKLKNGKDYIR